VMSGRGLCDELIPRPEESYRLWCVPTVCGHETSTKRGGQGPYRAVEPYKKKKKYILVGPFYSVLTIELIDVSDVLHLCIGIYYTWFRELNLSPSTLHIMKIQHTVQLLVLGNIQTGGHSLHSFF
jgi:hypothetical protein